MERQLTILILEDDESLREALEDLLVDENFQVQTAGDGRQAIEAVSQKSPDILVLDIKLPGIDGLEVLRQLKLQIPDLKSLVITGYASEEASIRAVRLGVGDYLQKPFPMRDFLNAINGLARAAHLQQKLKQKDSAVRKLSRWGLGLLAASLDLQSPTVGRSRVWAGQTAKRAAAHLNFSREASDTLELGVLFHLLARDETGHERLELVQETLPEEVLHVAESLQNQAPEDPTSLLALGCYLIGQVDGQNVTASPTFMAAVQAECSVEEEPSLQASSNFAVLGLAQTLRASGDIEGAVEALEQLAGVVEPSEVAGKALIQLAELVPAKSRSYFKTLISWLGKLSPLESAELQYHAGLVAVRLDMAEGPELLRRAWKCYREMDLAGEAARAGLALWVQTGKPDPEPLMSSLLAPQRGDLLTSTAPWLLEPLLMLTHSDNANRLILRLVRENPAAASRAGQNQATAHKLLDCFEELGEGPESTLKRLCGPEFSDDVTERARKLLSVGRSLPLLRLNFFGPFRVQVGSEMMEDKAWRTQKSRYVFACLASSQRPIPQEVLVEQFWPDSAPSRGLKNLYQALTDIRKVYEPQSDPVNRQGALLSLNSEYPVWSDQREFMEARKRGTAATEPQKAREAFYDALRLYEGPFLEGCHLDWAHHQRREFELQHFQLMEQLMGLCIEAQKPNEVLSVASKIIKIDPCHQIALVALMEAYIKIGRPEEVLRQYERAERVLRLELDLEPSIEMMRVLQKAKLAM